MKLLARMVLAGLALPLFVSPPIAAIGGPITTPALEDEAVATYDRVIVSVEGGHSVLDRSGAETNVVRIHFDGKSERDRTHWVSRSTSLIEQTAMACPISINGVCEPWIWRSWSVQGVPSLFGASALQGRTFSIGDSWVIPGACTACRTPIEVRVEPARPESPAGTAYVVNISASYFGDFNPATEAPRGVLHMGLQHAFPLLAELEPAQAWMGPQIFRLQSYVGGTPLSMGAAPPTYPTPLQQVPFEDGRPVEGEPVAPWPTWGEARDATDTPAPAGRFVGLSYSRINEWEVAVPRGPAIELRAEYSIEETYADGGNHTTTRYEAERTVAWPFVGTAWTKRTEVASAPSEEACDLQAAVPVWDAARRARGHPELVSVLYGVELISTCEGPFITVYGDHHPKPTGIVERLAMNGRDGSLWYALDWPDDAKEVI